MVYPLQQPTIETDLHDKEAVYMDSESIVDVFREFDHDTRFEENFPQRWGETDYVYNSSIFDDAFLALLKAHKTETAESAPWSFTLTEIADGDDYDSITLVHETRYETVTHTLFFYDHD